MLGTGESLVAGVDTAGVQEERGYCCGADCWIECDDFFYWSDCSVVSRGIGATAPDPVSRSRRHPACAGSALHQVLFGRVAGGGRRRGGEETLATAGKPCARRFDPVLLGLLRADNFLSNSQSLTAPKDRNPPRLRHSPSTAMRATNQYQHSSTSHFLGLVKVSLRE